MVAMALVDSDFAKDQLLLFLREWYMHPNGQIPGERFLSSYSLMWLFSSCIHHFLLHLIIVILFLSLTLILSRIMVNSLGLFVC